MGRRVLLNQGEPREALKAFRRAHELGAKARSWHYPSAEWVRDCEREVELDDKLPAFLRRQDDAGHRG